MTACEGRSFNNGARGNNDETAPCSLPKNINQSNVDNVKVTVSIEPKEMCRSRDLEVMLKRIMVGDFLFL